MCTTVTIVIHILTTLVTIEHNRGLVRGLEAFQE